MPTNAKTKAKKTAERKAAPKRGAVAKKSEAMNAVALLEADHREVEELFDEYEDTEEDTRKLELAQQICMALTVHTTIEEEIFYPAARAATKDNDLLDEAAVEHAGAKKLIAEIKAGKPGDDLYDAKVKVLSEQIKHHVKEEETELFPECESAKMDLDAVGAQLAKRKSALMKQTA